jgi:transcriptional regulator with XRE-family HTH domain
MTIPIHPLERWRSSQKKTQRDVAAEILCSDDVISRIEMGKPVRAKYIDRLVALAKGRLRRGDFLIVGPRRKSNGSKGEKAGQGRGASDQTPEKQRKRNR